MPPMALTRGTRRSTSIPDPHASRRAAAVQAAYAILTKDGASIGSGITGGQFVAEPIWTWRATDGFTITAAALEGILVGEWRRTPNFLCRWLFRPGAGYLQFSNMVLWLMGSPMAFRPGPPPPLSSTRYAGDFNEGR